MTHYLLSFQKAIRLFLMSFEFQKKLIQFCYLGHYKQWCFFLGVLHPWHKKSVKIQNNPWHASHMTQRSINQSEHVFLSKCPACSCNFCGSHCGCCLTKNISFCFEHCALKQKDCILISVYCVVCVFESVFR